MGSHPLNLAVRLLLELTALFSFGSWGWSRSPRGLAVALLVALPVLGAAIWGVFAVPNDPSRSGRAPVRVPGAVRLAIEILIFAAAAACLFGVYQIYIGLTFSGVTVLHYAFSSDRIRWLLQQR